MRERDGRKRRKAEDGPDCRILEEGVVEEAVHADCGENDAEDQ